MECLQKDSAFGFVGTCANFLLASVFRPWVKQPFRGGDIARFVAGGGGRLFTLGLSP